MTRSIPEPLKRTTTVRKNGSRRVSDSTGKESRVEPQHREECNINTIMRKMHAQGILPHFKSGGNFGDFTAYSDFHDCHNRILAAEADFMAMPSELRYKFDNDPGKLLDFLHDPANRAECVEMGLIAPDGYKPEKAPNSKQEASQAPSEPNQGANPTGTQKGQKAESPNIPISA